MVKKIAEHLHLLLELPVIIQKKDNQDYKGLLLLRKINI